MTPPRVDISAALQAVINAAQQGGEKLEGLAAIRELNSTLVDLLDRQQRRDDGHWTISDNRGNTWTIRRVLGMPHAASFFPVENKP